MDERMPLELNKISSQVDFLFDLIDKFCSLSDRPRDLIVMILANGTVKFGDYWGPILLLSVRPLELNHVWCLLMIQGDRSSQ